MEVIHEEPVISSFVPLSEHQSQTPQSFYSGPAVLYHLSKNALIKLLEADLHASPALSKLYEPSQSNGTNGSTDSQPHKELSITDVNVWVASDKFTLYRPSLSVGLSISYPTISLHAIQTLPTDPPSQGLYLQLATSDPQADPDAPEASLALTLVTSPTEPPHPPPTITGADEPPQRPIDALFAALSACANLHPDPVSLGSSDSEDDGYQDGEAEYDYEGEGEESAAFEYEVLDGQSGLPPPMPGSGGWITAENINEFFDEEGNWRGRGLGPGAGMVRGRNDNDEEAEADGPDGEESKWRRTN